MAATVAARRPGRFAGAAARWGQPTKRAAGAAPKRPRASAGHGSGPGKTETTPSIRVRPRSPYTFKDSLKNPWLRRVYIFHDIGLDRLVNTYRNPVLVTRPVTYGSCRGTRHTMDMDNVTSSVLVGARGVLTFENMNLQVGLLGGRVVGAPGWGAFWGGRG